MNDKRLEGGVRHEIFTSDVIQLGQDVYDGMERHRCIVANVRLVDGQGKDVHRVTIDQEEADKLGDKEVSANVIIYQGSFL